MAKKKRLPLGAFPLCFWRRCLGLPAKDGCEEICPCRLRRWKCDPQRWTLQLHSGLKWLHPRMQNLRFRPSPLGAHRNQQRQVPIMACPRNISNPVWTSIPSVSAAVTLAPPCWSAWPWRLFFFAWLHIPEAKSHVHGDFEPGCRRN